MRILTLVWSAGPGGTERAAVNLAIGYKLYGCHSRVLVLGEGDEREKDLAAAEVDAIFLLKDSRSEKEIIDEIKNWAPDIIHIHNLSPALHQYISQLRNEQTKVVETNVFSRPVYDKNYRWVDCSLQLTSWGYWRYTRLMKAAPHKPVVSVVPNIVATNKFADSGKEAVLSFREKHGIPQNAFVAGRVGQAHPAKWHEGIIDIINATIKPGNDIYYLFVGLPKNLTGIVNRQNDFFKSRVKLIDAVEGDERLSVCYCSMDCFVHWSAIGESFGYVLAEAMQCGVPVITMLAPFKDNGHFEVVGHQKGGICVVDKKNFIQAVVDFYNNPSLIAGFKKQLANGWVQKRYSFEAVMPGVVKMYRALLNGDKPTGNYNKNEVDNFFSFYKQKSKIKPMLLKMANTSFFYRLVKAVK